MADVAAAVRRRAAAVRKDVYEVILREIPQPVTPRTELARC
jgi:hypothetical protein